MAVSLRRVSVFLRPIFRVAFRIESPNVQFFKSNRNSSSFTFSGSSSWPRNRKKIITACLCAMTGTLATCASIICILDRSVRASEIEAKPPRYPWSVEGLFTSLDHRSVRRGWQVYKNVCSSCHSLRYFRFQDLVNVAYTENEMKTIAAEYQIDDGPDDDGNYYKRPGKIFDGVPPPFANEEAARAANNGALPVDLSLIVNARKFGKDYLFSLLTGYREPPAGVPIPDGQFFNTYFPGGAISMPEMIQDGGIEYDDGTPASSSQIAKDVVEFLEWTANQEWDSRKITCMKGIGVCAMLLAIIAHMHRLRWSTVKSCKIMYVPKRK